MDLLVRKEGRAGRITFNRPEALNALTHPMSLAIEAALDAWREDPEVALVLIDAAGERAFCAGGDIAAVYHAGKAGDFDGPRRFWRDEYRMNAKIHGCPKPVVALMQGFVMGGGVGVGCHAGHRIVGETSQIAMPECGIGLVPDVGGTLILARAPGRLGEYLGITGARMGPADAILAGFADRFVPQAAWPDLVARLVESGEVAAIEAAAEAPPEGRLAPLLPRIDALFAEGTLVGIVAALRADRSSFAAETLAAIGRNSPLSMCCTVELLRRLRAAGPGIERALELEYRFTHRALGQADFLEGIRAQIIDKDRKPRWRHPAPEAVGPAEIEEMLAPLGDRSLDLRTEERG